MLVRFVKQYGPYAVDEIVNLEEPLAGQLLDHGVAVAAGVQPVHRATHEPQNVETADVKHPKARKA